MNPTIADEKEREAEKKSQRGGLVVGVERVGDRLQERVISRVRPCE